MSGALTFQNINQVILNMLDQMHNVCICIAMLIIFLSVYRNYQQFGEYLGIKYLAGVLLAIVFIALFPVMSDYLFKGMLRWGMDAGKRVEESVKVLLSIEVDGSWYEAVVVGIANLFYRGGIWLGKCVRDLVGIDLGIKCQLIDEPVHVIRFVINSPDVPVQLLR